jgi:hypothetical protein
MDKIRLRPSAKLPFGISPEVTSNLISTQKTETLLGAKGETVDFCT